MIPEGRRARASVIAQVSKSRSRPSTDLDSACVRTLCELADRDVAGFRGDSRFTTWAYKFVMYEVSTKMGRHFWRHRHASMDADSWVELPDLGAVAPDQRTEHREIFQRLHRAIDQDLTPLQRRVFVAVALNEVPMDAMARELGGNRNSVYKVLFDARRKLRESLATAGYERPTQPSGSAA